MNKKKLYLPYEALTATNKSINFKQKQQNKKSQRALKAEFEIHPVFPSLNLIFDQVS